MHHMLATDNMNYLVDEAPKGGSFHSNCSCKICTDGLQLLKLRTRAGPPCTLNTDTEVHQIKCNSTLQHCAHKCAAQFDIKDPSSLCISANAPPMRGSKKEPPAGLTK